MAELSVMVFGLGFGGHVDSRRSIKRVLLVTTSIALIYSTIQVSNKSRDFESTNQ